MSNIAREWWIYYSDHRNEDIGVALSKMREGMSNNCSEYRAVDHSAYEAALTEIAYLREFNEPRMRDMSTAYAKLLKQNEILSAGLRYILGRPIETKSKVAASEALKAADAVGGASHAR